MSDIKKVLLENYMPYAKSTIIARAIPAIDGLKPVNRRILYTMYKMGLLTGNKTKSANIVGQVMKYHPHGDMAIYEAMVRMTRGNGTLLVPYIDSKGNFGKVYSRDTKFAAPRYTEAKLAEICKEIFDNIDEDAVDFVNNYDDTLKEPVLLPVKFPTILVNTSSGIAVGRSSNIPSFGLKAVCEATIGIIEGRIKDAESLAEVLGAPEFSTCGYIHGTKEDYESLVAKGTGSVVMSGTVETYSDRIIITEIPYRTTIEDILDQIISAVKDGELKEVVDVKDESDLNGLRGVIYLKNGSNVSTVLKKINRLTELRMKMSFITRVILKRDNKLRCVEVGLLELLNEWIAFRISTIQRIYKYKRTKRNEQVHLLESWEKIANDIKNVANFITNNDESVVMKYLMSTYNMDKTQAEYIMEMKVKEFTKDRLSKRLNELASAREDIKIFTRVIDSDTEKKNIIVSELKDIINKYGTDRKSIMTGPVVDDSDELYEEEKIEDVPVSVVVTKRGYLKRLVTLRDEGNFVMHDDDSERWRFVCSNKDTLLVFTYSGRCYKIPVHKIDASKGVPKDYIYNIIDKQDNSEVLYIAPAGDYSGHINIVYENGRGVQVRFTDVSGNRSKYKSLFMGGTRKTLWCTPEDKFFIITKGKRAAYTDITGMSELRVRSAFKVARVGDDEIFGIQPLKNVPNYNNIDLRKYSMGYCIKIKDKLW